METTTIFNPIQLTLLQMFSRMTSEQELQEVKQLLSDYYFSKVEQRAVEIFNKKGWTQETLDTLSNSHFRTPYK
ncbi:MAG: hypothetical protein K6F33_11365 [Bacteroidales bacterium]|nr:hypothetical protein [Bacteroidales bacterium]